MKKTFYYLGVCCLCFSLFQNAFGEDANVDLDLRQFQSQNSNTAVSQEQLKELVKMLYKNKKFNGKSVEEMSEAEMVKALGSELKQVQIRAGDRNKALQEILDSN
jgi:hypothetical protein